MTNETKTVLEKWREECPDFNDFEYQKILDWLADGDKGSVVWSDTFVNGHGEEFKDEEFAHWSFAWKFGFIGWDAFSKEEEEKAKKAVAIFVWLWLKKRVPAEYAEKFEIGRAHV